MEKININNLKEKFKIPAIGLGITIAIVLFVTLFAEISYRPKTMIKRGFEISLNGAASAKKEEKIIDFASLFKVADFEKGKKIFKKCASCHTIGRGEASKVGPNLHQIIGRKRGSKSGFKYSDAMTAKGGSWDINSINQFITKPKDYLPGTKMAFPGLKKPQDRADVILYLQKMSK